MRQVNYPGYPSASPANPAQPVADNIENLSFSYDIINSVAPAGTYALGAGDAPTPLGGDSPSQIRAVNTTLAARSDCSLLVTFAPTASGMESAFMLVTDMPDPLGPYTVSLSAVVATLTSTSLFAVKRKDVLAGTSPAMTLLKSRWLYDHCTIGRRIFAKERF